MSAIEWTDRTWNPTLGCSMAKGSETGGCLNCYAARMAMRNLWPGGAYARMTKSGPRWNGEVKLRPERLDAPLHWRDARQRLGRPLCIFVDSMSDLFHEALQWSDIASVFGMMACSTAHTFQVLTKRPERMLEFSNLMAARDHRSIMANALAAQPIDYSRALDVPSGWPLPNVWLGVSVENQETANARIPLLLKTPAAKRFVSYEPALGPVDFRAWLPNEITKEGRRGEYSRRTDDRVPPSLTFLDWVIFGGESGPHARSTDLQWARVARNQCSEIAFFMKQAGAHPYDSLLAWKMVNKEFEPTPQHAASLARLIFKSAKGGDPAEWPEDLRVREFPC